MKTYEALKKAGTPDDAASAAAEELAVYESRIVNVERKLSILQWQVTYLMVMMRGIALRLIFS